MMVKLSNNFRVNSPILCVLVTCAFSLGVDLRLVKGCLLSFAYVVVKQVLVYAGTCTWSGMGEKLCCNHLFVTFLMTS